jgi:sialidase-1
MGFYGHPLAAVRLPDNRVFVTYGYRRNPCGIRARILNAECTDFATAKEIVLRDDNGPGTDVGYSWPVVLDDGRVLVVYYITRENGIRYIGGTIVEL